MRTNAPNFELREARQADYSFAERLYLATMQPLLSQLGALDEQDLVANFKRLYRPGDVQIIVVDGVDAGWMQVAEDDEEISLFQIHIEAGYRSQGIGTSLMQDLLARSRRQRKPVSLYVVRNNPATELYKRLGFKVMGEDGTRLHMRWE